MKLDLGLQGRTRPSTEAQLLATVFAPLTIHSFPYDPTVIAHREACSSGRCPPWHLARMLLLTAEVNVAFTFLYKRKQFICRKFDCKIQEMTLKECIIHVYSLQKYFPFI